MHASDVDVRARGRTIFGQSIVYKLPSRIIDSTLAIVEWRINNIIIYKLCIKFTVDLYPVRFVYVIKSQAGFLSWREREHMPQRRV